MWNGLKSQHRRQLAIFERQLAAWIQGYSVLGGRIFCARGCSNCCSLAVNCTFIEALDTAESLTIEQISRVNAHAVKVRTLIAETADLKTFLKMHRSLLGNCPLLGEDGACGAYQVRPLSCRSLLSTKESRWCSADFSRLTESEKAGFLESLDRDVVAFPMHYVSMTQEIGRDLEASLSQQMTEQAGFSLYGNFPVLMHLVLEHRLSSVIGQGYSATVSLLEREGFAHPFLAIVAL